MSQLPSKEPSLELYVEAMGMPERKIGQKRDNGKIWMRLCAGE